MPNLITNQSMRVGKGRDSGLTRYMRDNFANPALRGNSPQVNARLKLRAPLLKTNTAGKISTRTPGEEETKVGSMSAFKIG